MKSFFSSFNLILFSLLFLFSCDGIDDPTETPFISIRDGLFVVNEGIFGQGTGSVTFRNIVNDELTNDLFTGVNDLPLGDVPQSIFQAGEFVFIIVNNSSKVEVVSQDSFSSLQTLTDFSSPRYGIQVDPSKAYITDWISNSVKIVNLNDLSVSGSIAVGNGPEELLLVGDKVYVANSGGFGIDNTISVIDPTTDLLVETITVGDGPVRLKSNGANEIVVLCRGDYGDFVNDSTNTAGSIHAINTLTNEVTKLEEYGMTEHPTAFDMRDDGSEIFVLHNGIQKYSRQDMSNPETISNSYYYNIGFYPATGELYLSDPKDFSSKGQVVVMFPSGVRRDSFETGIIPGNIHFGK